MSTVDETNILSYASSKLREKILIDESVKHVSVKQIHTDYTPTYRNGLNRLNLKINQSGISGHHCIGKGCSLCKSEIKLF